MSFIINKDYTFFDEIIVERKGNVMITIAVNPF